MVFKKNSNVERVTLNLEVILYIFRFKKNRLKINSNKKQILYEYIKHNKLCTYCVPK